MVILKLIILKQESKAEQVKEQIIEISPENMLMPQLYFR